MVKKIENGEGSVMSSKFKTILLNLFLLSFLVSYHSETAFALKDTCEEVEVNLKSPLHHQVLSSSAIKETIRHVQKTRELTLPKAKGVVGELVAKKAIESGKLTYANQIPLVSITTMFSQKGCEVIPYLRDNADRGIDDIFVVLKKDGWINKNYPPLFHESKYDTKCDLKLRPTKTLCDQLSLQWLTGNLAKAQKRTRRAKLCFGEQSAFTIEACKDCKTNFQENMVWLESMLNQGKFNRTASLLCSDGNFNIYKVTGTHCK